MKRGLTSLSNFLKVKLRSSEMALWLGTLIGKPEDLSSISRIQMGEGGN